MSQTMQQPHPLQAFLAECPPEAALRLRTLAHAWEGGGGQLHVGRLAVRLLASDGRGHSFTAATLHRRHGEHGAALELGRVLLQAHGLAGQAWTAWCDELADLRAYGFDPDAKFPVVRVTELPDASLARLALGVRDLARLVAQHAANRGADRTP
jgi:hypothetical protein